jgi:Calcineurin-like phosphoesterase
MRARALVFSALLAAGCGCPAVPRDRAWPRPAVVADAAPPRPAGAARLVVGGDSRKSFTGDASGQGVLRWAFALAGRAGASAFLYLGDMQRTPPAESYFEQDLATLSPSVVFCPVYGNHEALFLGAVDVFPDSLGTRRFARDFLPGCVGPELPVVAERATAGRVYYSVELPGDVHFVALDNVSPALGFGEAQLLWLAQDLASARARRRRIVVGMHKALSGNGVTGHSMDEDVDAADPGRVWRDGGRALQLFLANGVELVFASHEHGYWEHRQPGTDRGIRSFITGGLGAPLKTCAGPDHAFFHVLVLDVLSDRIEVTPVRYPGSPPAGP